MAVTSETQLPHNVEAEASALGCVLINPETLIDLMDILEPQDFYTEAHRLLYSALCDLWIARRGLDLITICDELARRGHLDAVGGSGFVSDLTSQVFHSGNARRYGEMVERCSVLRRLIRAAGEIAAAAYTSQEDVDEVIAVAHAEIANATLRHGGNDSVPFADAVDAFLAECDDAIANGVTPGVMTGFSRLDDHLLGFLPGELVYLCGRPGSGKSSYAAAIAAHHAALCAARGEGGVEWVSLEMSYIQQAKRLITSWASVNGRMIRAAFRRPDGSVDQDAYNAVRKSAAQLKASYGHTLRLYDKPLTMKQLRQHLTRAVHKRGATLAIVDYLGLLDADDAKASDYKRISDMSRELKRLAMELNIPIICLVQLNREAEKRANKRPMLSDLRDSGGLEQDADFVIGVYRSAYYGTPSEFTMDARYQQFAELIVLKAREGVANVSIPTRFESEYTRPSDWPSEWAYDLYLRDGDESGAMSANDRNSSGNSKGNGHGQRQQQQRGVA